MQTFRALEWDNSKLHDASPFQMVDPGFNAILIRSCHDIADLAERLGLDEIAVQSRDMARRGLDAMETLWNDRLGQFACLDRTTGDLLDSPSIGGILAAFAPIPKARAAALSQRVEVLSELPRSAAGKTDKSALAAIIDRPGT